MCHSPVKAAMALLGVKRSVPGETWERSGIFPHVIYVNYNLSFTAMAVPPIHTALKCILIGVVPKIQIYTLADRTGHLDIRAKCHDVGCRLSTVQPNPPRKILGRLWTGIEGEWVITTSSKFHSKTATWNHPLHRIS